MHGNNLEIHFNFWSSLTVVSCSSLETLLLNFSFSILLKLRFQNWFKGGKLLKIQTSSYVLFGDLMVNGYKFISPEILKAMLYCILASFANLIYYERFYVCYMKAVYSLFDISLRRFHYLLYSLCSTFSLW